LVRFGFGFISKKLKKPNRTPTEKNQKKTKPNQAKIEPKPEKTEPKMRKLSQNRENQAEPEKPSQTGLNRFWFFKKKYFCLVTFFDKKQTEPKMITPSSHLN